MVWSYLTVQSLLRVTGVSSCRSLVVFWLSVQLFPLVSLCEDCRCVRCGAMFDDKTWYNSLRWPLTPDKHNPHPLSCCHAETLHLPNTALYTAEKRLWRKREGRTPENNAQWKQTELRALDVHPHVWLTTEPVYIRKDWSVKVCSHWEIQFGPDMVV